LLLACKRCVSLVAFEAKVVVSVQEVRVSGRL
jgi:hypothetical protein